MSGQHLLEMKGIVKRFPGVTALSGVNFKLNAGEVHVLCGENGAGKSTLMKILAGIYSQSEGEVFVDGELVCFSRPADSESSGISIVHQELSLSPTVTVGENIFLGNEVKKFGFVLDRKTMYEEAEVLLKRLGAAIRPAEKLGNLNIADQQLVQIAKALSLNPRILIMDEPFSSLSDEESDKLFVIMDSLRKDGVGIVYIDHRIDNFYKIGDRVTVLRDGEYVDTKKIPDVTREEIIAMMVGRPLENLYPKFNKVNENIKFSVSNLTSHKVSNISFDVREGEIFGLSGLVGAGRTEILKAIFGTNRKENGAIAIDGVAVHVNSVADSVKNGIALIPENRKLEGLVLERSVKFNTSLIVLRELSIGPFVSFKKENLLIDEHVGKLQIKVSNTNNPVTSLSGGNQQKVVLAKWLALDNLKVLLLDEPTRGIDVGSKQEIYKLINELANNGIAVVLVTSELPELINLCDRVAVVRNGQITGTLNREELTQENIMELSI